MKTLTVATLKLDRVTKGAVLYKVTGDYDGTAITSIYLRKDGLKEPFPTDIRLTLEVAD